MIELSQGNIQQLLKLAIMADGSRIRLRLIDGNHLRVDYRKGSGGMGGRQRHRKILRLSDSEWVTLG